MPCSTITSNIYLAYFMFSTRERQFHYNKYCTIFPVEKYCVCFGVLSVRPLLDISLFSFSFFQPPTLAGAVVLLNPGKRTKTLITGFSDLTTFRFTLEWFIRLQPVPWYGTSRYPLYILPPPPLRYILSSLFAFFSRDTELYVFCFVRHGKSLLSRLYRPLSFFFLRKSGIYKWRAS